MEALAFGMGLYLLGMLSGAAVTLWAWQRQRCRAEYFRMLAVFCRQRYERELLRANGFEQAIRAKADGRKA